jgi:hypothetical protein
MRQLVGAFVELQAQQLVGTRTGGGLVAGNSGQAADGCCGGEG